MLILVLVALLTSGCMGKSDLLKQTTADWLAKVDKIYDQPLPFFNWNEGDLKIWGAGLAPLMSLGVFLGLLVALVGGVFMKTPKAYVSGFVIMIVCTLISTLPAIYMRFGKSTLASLDPPLTLRLAAQAENWPGHDGALISSQTITEGDLDWVSAVNGMVFISSAVPALHTYHFVFSMLILLVGIYAAAFAGGKIRWVLVGAAFLLFNLAFPRILWLTMMSSVKNGGISDSPIWATLFHWNMIYPIRMAVLLLVVLVVFPVFLGSVISATVHLELDPYDMLGARIRSGDDRRTPFERLKDGKTSVQDSLGKLRRKPKAPANGKDPGKGGPDPRASGGKTSPPSRSGGSRTSPPSRSGGGTPSDASGSNPSASSSGGSSSGGRVVVRRHRPQLKRPQTYVYGNSQPPASEDERGLDSDWGGGITSSSNRVLVPRFSSHSAEERRPIIVEGEAHDVETDPSETQLSARESGPQSQPGHAQGSIVAKGVVRDMSLELITAVLKGG
jgi:hypothetical protein